MEAPDTLRSRLVNAQPGDVLDLAGVDPFQLPSLPVTRDWTGGTLVLSNSPEQLTGPGVLYRSALPPGPARVMLYHANFVASDLRLAVVLAPADPSDPPLVTLNRSVRRGPSLDYLQVGRRSALDLIGLADNPQSTTVNRPMVLDPLHGQLSGFRAQALIIAYYDLEIIGGRLNLTILAHDPPSDPLQAAQDLPFLSREPAPQGGFKHDRGTFPGQANREIRHTPGLYSTASGMARLRMANGLADPTPLPDGDRDAFAGEDGTGIDEVLNIPSQVSGNYGVMYTVRMGWQNPDGRRVTVLLNPRAGSYAGAIGEQLDTGEVPAALTPHDPDKSVSDSAAATVLGSWDPAQHPQVTLRWTPPGASNLPVEWILVPF
jgi:hypothetical protein